MKSAVKGIFSLILTLAVIIWTIAPGSAAELEDSSIFVDAFNAYQQKDYLLAIEKCDQLNQVFPDSPLRDVTLLLIARASLKSGENERAAKAVTLFSSEFPESSLKTSVEDDLKVLAVRLQKGETLDPNKPLQIAAQKVRSDMIALERAAIMKLEMEQAAKVKAEQERIARVKQEEERREKERQLAEKRAKASIKLAITIPGDRAPVSVGDTGVLPVEITNKGINSEEFLLSVTSAKDYDAALIKSKNSYEKISRLKLAAGETFKGIVSYKMPIEMVDGHRSSMGIKAVSAKFNDISFQQESVVISAAPLVRADAKLAKQKVMPGEKLGYRLTILNVGSLPAQKMSIKLQLPPQIEFQTAPHASYTKDPDGSLVFKIDQIDIGKLADIYLEVKVREDSVAGQKLRGKIEATNNSLHRKDNFTTSPSIVQ